MEWNLKLIYEDYAEFLTDLDLFKEDIANLEGLKGKLNSLEGFLEFKRLSRIADDRLSKLFRYASMKHDLNQKDEKSNEDYQRVYQLYGMYSVKTAFMTPEILANGKDKVMSIIDSNNELEPLRFMALKLFRSQDYFLDEKSEKLLANDGEALGLFNRLYDKLAVSDNVSNKVVLSNGDVLDINESNFRYYLGILDNQEDRRIVFETIFKFYDERKNTFAGIYEGIIKSELAEVKNRGYNSILESHLYYNNIDTQVFYSLVDTARNNSKPLKKYYALRKKYFKLDKLHTYDRFLNFTSSDKVYDYQTSKNMVLDACKSLGDDYYNHACKALEDGRVSVQIKDGKRTGAYSTSLYNEGTFILLNHNNNLDGAFTIAHEAGHSIHSLYSNENQEMENANYTIFVAEIASTFNEQLFLDYVMKNSTSKEEKIVVLQQAIDNIVSTFYRQTLFANFELLAHNLAEDNKPITSSSLSKIMHDLYLDYYDIDLNDEPYKEMVWAYIPHFFHTPFYVYQYATSFAASLAIYENVKNNVPNSFDNYLKMLSMGGSKYPIDIVKTAGVDLTKTDAFMAVINRLEELTNELEKLLK